MINFMISLVPSNLHTIGSFEILESGEVSWLERNALCF